MLRRHHTLLSAFSLVLCVAACALWIRSSYVCDVYRTQFGGRVTSNLRAMSFGSFHPAENKSGYWCGPAMRNDYEYDGSPGIRHDWRLLGFRWRVTDGGAVPGFIYHGYGPPIGASGKRAVVFRWRRGWSVEIPHWFLAVIFAILPLRWLRLRLKGGSRLDGKCQTCGYDLRATPHRCPECGTATIVTPRECG
jgi:hypothetical protein